MNSRDFVATCVKSLNPMYLLFPGRHHLMTDYQFKYLFRLIQSQLYQEIDIDGNRFIKPLEIKAIIFAVTSANHSNTRRNPVPFYIRSIMLQDFAKDLNVPSFIYGIDDIGIVDDFASYTLKRIAHESDYTLQLSPENTLVICSTPVFKLYQKIGFTILPSELADKENMVYQSSLPWQVVEKIAEAITWQADKDIIRLIHPASYKIWDQYKIGEKVQQLFNDHIVGDDGDITETRDYSTYVKQMDETAELKYSETAPYIQAGRIGDIGCAVASWIKLACLDQRLKESDFYGIEVARQFYDICQQRKHNQEFENPNVFFAQRNAVTGLAFQRNSMHTIHTSSLTHEIESYGSRADLLQFIKNRYEELAYGGVWINRDVVGPENKTDKILMRLNKQDGRNEDYDKSFDDSHAFKTYLDGLSTFGKFLRFGIDFRKEEGYSLEYKIELVNNEEFISLSLSDACEFMSRKDYTDNWLSEMHETFTFWSFNDWLSALKQAGFTIDLVSKAYVNQWIVNNRLKGKIELYKIQNNKLSPVDFPVTNMLIVARK